MDVAAKLAPVVLDIGKQKKKRIRQLKDGEGRLADKVDAAIEQAQARVGADKSIVPVIIIYRKKERRRLKGLAF